MVGHKSSVVRMVLIRESICYGAVSVAGTIAGRSGRREAKIPVPPIAEAVMHITFRVWSGASGHRAEVVVGILILWSHR